MTDCIFCMIAKKEAAASIVYEDEEVMAFLDINPVQRGHTLVIPKEHFVNIWDIETDVLARVDSVAKQVAHKMAKVLNSDGINTFSANGRSAGQEVFHFHMHVIPLGKGEWTKFADWWLSRVTKAERSELEELASKLKI